MAESVCRSEAGFTENLRPNFSAAEEPSQSNYTVKITDQ